ncbi:MAG: lysostaphin resistance A-like protein [Faecousia sp.]
MNSDLKKGRRDYSIIGLVLVAVFLLSQGGMYLIYFLTDGNISSLFGGLFTENDAYILLSGGIMYLFAIPIGLLLLHFLPSTQPQKERLGSQFFQWLLICFPIISAGALIGNLLSFLLSFGKASNPTDSLSGLSIGVQFVCVVVLAPIFEELLFRRAIIRHSVRYGEKTAILFSATAFALFHGNLFQFFYAFGIGLLFGYIYVRTGKLIYTIFLHAIINFWGTIVAQFVITNTPAFFVSNDLRSLLHLTFQIVVTLNYYLISYGTLVGGIILLCKKVRRLYFRPAPLELPTGKSIQLSFVNPGAILFAILCTAEIVISLLP